MADTNSGGKFYIAATTSGAPAVITPTPQPDDLTQAEYEALDWVEVSNVGSLPDSGSNTNIVNYDTIDTDVTQKQKGVTDAGSGTLECARKANDPGQQALRAAGLTKFYYAFKRELTDAPDTETTNTIYYNRGLVTGPVHNGGRNEDFVLETFTLGYVQREIVVGPTAIPDEG
jgi:hypothetical protein